MIKKKEVLIILGLAGLLVVLGSFYCRTVNEHDVLALIPTRACGFPADWPVYGAWNARSWADFIPTFLIASLINFVIWFLVLTISWLVLKLALKVVKKR